MKRVSVTLRGKPAVVVQPDDTGAGWRVFLIYPRGKPAMGAYTWTNNPDKLQAMIERATSLAGKWKGKV